MRSSQTEQGEVKRNQVSTYMPFSYDIDPGRQRAVVTLSGVVTGATVNEAMDAMAGDERWDTGYDRIWDGSTIESLVVFPEEFSGFLTTRGEGRRRSRRVAIVARTHNKEFALMYQKALRERPISVFHSLDDAHAWLDKSPAEERPDAKH